MKYLNRQQIPLTLQTGLNFPKIELSIKKKSHILYIGPRGLGLSRLVPPRGYFLLQISNALASPVTQSAMLPWVAVTENLSPIQCMASHFLSGSLQALLQIPQGGAPSGPSLKLLRGTDFLTMGGLHGLSFIIW